MEDVFVYDIATSYSLNIISIIENTMCPDYSVLLVWWLIKQHDTWRTIVREISKVGQCVFALCQTRVSTSDIKDLMESLEHFMDAQILNHPSVMIIDEDIFPLSSR